MLSHWMRECEAYQRGLEGGLEAERGGHRQDGVEAAEHRPKQQHLGRVRVNWHLGQVVPQRGEVLVGVKGVLR